MKINTVLSNKLLVCAIVALSITGCVNNHRAEKSSAASIHREDFNKTGFVEVDRYHVKYSREGLSFIEPKSPANGHKKVDPYVLTKGVSFSVNQEEFSETILHKNSQVFSGKEDWVINALLERVNMFINENGLPEQSVTAEIIVNGYANRDQFRKNTSGIPSPISCDLGLLDAYVVDGKKKEAVSYKIKRGQAIKDNRLLSLARSCYVLKKVQVRASSSSQNYLQRVSYSLFAYVNTQIRGVKINLRLRSPVDQ